MVTDSFAQVCHGNPAHGCHPPVDLGNGHGTLVRLDEKAGQRHRPHRLFLKPLPKREAEAVTQQFLRQRRLTPKSMNNPRNTGLQRFLQTQPQPSPDGQSTVCPPRRPVPPAVQRQLPATSWAPVPACPARPRPQPAPADVLPPPAVFPKSPASPHLVAKPKDVLLPNTIVPDRA